MVAVHGADVGDTPDGRVLDPIEVDAIGGRRVDGDALDAWSTRRRLPLERARPLARHRRVQHVVLLIQRQTPAVQCEHRQRLRPRRRGRILRALTRTGAAR